MNARCPKCEVSHEFVWTCDTCREPCVVDAPEFCQAHAEAAARLHGLIDEAVGKFPRTAGHSLEERLADLVKTYKDLVADRFKRNEDHIAAAVAKAKAAILKDAQAVAEAREVNAEKRLRAVREDLTAAKEQLFATERELEAYRALIAQADEIRKALSR